MELFKTKRREGVMSKHLPSSVFFKFYPVGSEYPYAEVIRYTEWSGAESQPRFGPPGFGLGTPSPGFSPGSGL